MKKSYKRNNGFTLIELLAVIVILGILAVTAIPAINRVIENSRKDTFINTAKEYAVQATNLFSGDGIRCYYCTDANGTGRDPDCSSRVLTGVGQAGVRGNSPVVSSALDNGIYFIPIDTYSSGDIPVLLEQGGKSSWGNRNVAGYVLVEINGFGSNKNYNYYVALSDGTHYVTADKLASKLDRNDIKSDGTGLDVNWLPFEMVASLVGPNNGVTYYGDVHKLSLNFHVFDIYKVNDNTVVGGKALYEYNSDNKLVLKGEEGDDGLKNNKTNKYLSGFYDLSGNTLPNAGYCVSTD